MKRLILILTISLLFLPFNTGMSSKPGGLAPLGSIYYVDTSIDSNAIAYQACTSALSDCSLRGAITKSNSTIADIDGISIPAGTYTLTLPGTDDNNDFGDLDIWAPVQIAGAGQGNTFIQAGTAWDTGIDRVFHIFNAIDTVRISDLTVRYGKVTAFPGGGGIFQDGPSSVAIINRVTIFDNRISNTAPGGGVLVEGNMTMNDVTVMENSTLGVGGGVSTALNSNLTMNRSTVVINEANSGAGIYLNDDAVLRNVTVYNNLAMSSAGGIMQMYDDSVLTMYNTTVYDNRLFESLNTSGWAISFDGSVSVYSTILAAENLKFPCEDYGTISGFSNMSTNTGCGASFTVADPRLAPIANNGGITQTARLLFGSPAIDGGDNGFCQSEDQRAVTRPIDGDGDGTATCDIGAYEAYPVAAFMPLIKKP